jgi:hypothetical protein
LDPYVVVGPKEQVKTANPRWRRNQIAVVAPTFVGISGFTLVMPFLASYIQALGVTDTGAVAPDTVRSR